VKLATVVLVVSAGLATSSAAASTQPPMGQFLGAYYTCDQGGSFEISYDSKSPKVATITTSNNDHRYQLKRVAGATGPQFSNGTVNVSVSADGAQVQGTTVSLTDCKLKNTT
jgi:hypothetical protein